MSKINTKTACRHPRLILLFAVLIFGIELNYAHAYPAPQLHRAMVFSYHDGVGSPRTVFFAIISGPSPIDVKSFTATGPSGTFNLNSSLSFQQYGLYYATVENAILGDGSYTFTLTDSTDRTVSVVRDFVYDDSIPAPSSLVPANQSYVGTTTPTLSFSPVEGNYSYQIQIRDYDQNAIWYTSGMMTSPSVTVPGNVLQPNTPYLWVARIWDMANQNMREIQAFFYTGTKGAPEINMWGILSFPWGEDDLLNYPYARGQNVAPWDIDYFTVTGPDETVYELNRRYFRFWLPAFNAAIISFDPPKSVPDGTYTFEIKNILGQKASKTRTYNYDPVPDFIQDSRVPGDNAYLDTLKPTFSWSRVQGDTGNGEYLYGIRIVDYTTKIRWFDSPKSTETTFTPAEPLNLPRGSSYKWQVDVIDASGNNFNYSGYRVLTTNPEPAPSTLYVSATDDTCGGNDPCHTSIQDAIALCANISETPTP